MTKPDTSPDDSSEDDEPNAQYKELWYHKTINADDKNPLEPWSDDMGYAGADPSDLPKVYSYPEAKSMDHQHFAVNGIVDAPDGTKRSLLIFDLDVHKAPDDFDPDSVRPPTDTLIVRSQSGGFHVYFIVEEPRAASSIRDFTISDHVPFDIDVRGSYVKHHVIAPADFPGFGGQYEIVNDEPILTVSSPHDAVERLYVNAEHAVRYTPDRETPAVNVDIDRDAEPPEDMPHCYHQGLLLRAACPDDPNLDTHDVNSLTALCGLHHGYSVDDMVDHFCEQFPPAEYNDRSKTRDHLLTLERKVEASRLAPPAVGTLKAAGILDADDTCKCDIDYHGGRSTPRPTFDVFTDAEPVEAADQEDTDDPTPPSEDQLMTDNDTPTHVPDRTLQDEVQDTIQSYRHSDDMTQKTVMHRVAVAMTQYRNFVYPAENVENWRATLHRYDEDTGIYRPDGERYVAELGERLLEDMMTSRAENEIRRKVKRLSTVPKHELETEPHRRVVGNGILDLETKELDPFTPDEYHRSRINVNYDPGATCPRIDQFFHEIVEDKDVLTLYQIVSHTLYGDYDPQSAAMLVGGGKNGKSVYLSLIEALLGGENVSHQALQELTNNTFSKANLYGKLANFHPDMSGEKIEDVSEFKNLTGDEPVDANVKFESPITFDNKATLVFAANTMPKIEEDTNALWRRWLYINFPYEFDNHKEEAKKQLPKRVLMGELTADEELQGLLARAVDELSEQLANEDAELFDHTPAPEQVREIMKRAAEPVYAFATSCLQETEERSKDDGLPKDDVMDAFRKFAREEDLPMIDKSPFGEQLLNIKDMHIESGRKRIDGHRVMVYQGVTWSSRGRELLGLDTPDDPDQKTVQGARNASSSPPERADELRSVLRSAGADSDPMSVDMIIGTAMGAGMDMQQARYAFDDLKDAGDVFNPADAPTEKHYLLTD